MGYLWSGGLVFHKSGRGLFSQLVIWFHRIITCQLCIRRSHHPAQFEWR